MLRVLVVEDSEDTSTTQAALLAHWGYDVRVAGDGEAALKEAARFRPHVVLLDIGMPGMTGYEVARRLREQKGSERATIICISGFAGEEYRRRAQEVGCDDYLAKPADPAELHRLLEVCSSPER